MMKLHVILSLFDHLVLAVSTVQCRNFCKWIHADSTSLEAVIIAHGDKELVAE